MNGFDLQNGFTLEVTYNVVDVQSRLTIGLLEEAGAVQDAGGLATSGAVPYHGIVFNPVAYDGQNRYPNAVGLQFSDGTNATQQLSDAQARGGVGIHTLVLQMDADSNWSYSVDGAVATTGTIGGAGFDLTRDYRFFVRNQQSSIANNIQSVTLSTDTGGTGGNDFSDWVAPYFPGETDPAIIGWDADPDGDGNDNGLENFFGTAPDEFTQGLVSGTVSGNTFTFTHPLNATPADDISAFYEWSTDLQAYHADGASNGAGSTVNFSTQLDTPTVGMTTVTATLTGTVPDRWFVRLGVSQN